MPRTLPGGVVLLLLYSTILGKYVGPVHVACIPGMSNATDGELWHELKVSKYAT